MKQRRNNTGAVILGVLVGLAFAMLLLGFYPSFAPKTVKAAAGSFAVYREATATDTITTTLTNLDWDTTVVEGAGFSISGSDITLTEAGHYLVTYSVGYETTSGTSRSEMQAQIDVNGTNQPYGRSSCYIRRTQSIDECWASGSAIIQTSGASQTVRIETYRTDSNTTAGVQRKANDSGISVLRLDDTWDFARYQDVSGNQVIGNSTYDGTTVNFDTNDEQDATFTRTGNSVDLSAAGHYLVTYNVYMQNTSGGRRQNEFRLVLNTTTEIEGTRTTAYVQGSDSANDHVASYTGIINVAAGDDLTVEARCDSESCGSTDTLGGAVGLTIAKLPDSADYIRLYEAGGLQAVDGTNDPILWDTNSEVDTSSFSHSTVTNTSRINIDNAGDYLFMGSFLSERTPLTSGNRMLPHWEWRKNGTTELLYGDFAKHNRGDAASAGVCCSGASAGIIMNGLTSTDYVELINTDESDQADANHDFAASRYAVQGVNIASLFPTDATVTTSGTQTATVLPATTDFYMGGTLVITETGGASRNVTGITISENGTVNGLTGLDNIRLYYDLDTTVPYDCASESFSGFPAPSETQYGVTDTTGFSAADGTSSFTGTVAINTTQTMCVYVALDTLSGTANTTIEIEIADPSSDVTVSAGTIGPASAVLFAGTTNIDGRNDTQIRYHWRNDDGSEAAATSMSSGNEDRYLRIDEGDTNRLRVEVSNEGSLTGSSRQFRLEYGELGFFDTDCSAYAGAWTDVGAVAGAWDMSDSTNLTDGADTTDIAIATGGVTNENTTFIVNNNAVKDTSSQTAAISLASTEFVEMEYSIQALAAATNGAMYCFRVSDAGTALETYTTYPRVVVSTANDFQIQRGVTTITGTTATITAGVDYFPPASLANSFIRIIDTQSTGAGENVDDDLADNADEVTANVSAPQLLLTSVAFSRASAVSDTRISWEIIEYIGPAGGVNEFIVRGQGALSFSSAGIAVSQVISGVVDGNDVVPWITGIRNPNAGTSLYDTMRTTAIWDDINGEIDFTRGRASGNAVGISYAAVEFIGANWRIQRLEHNGYTAAGVGETENPTIDFSSIDRVFLYTQKRMSSTADIGLDDYGHDVYVSAAGVGSAVTFTLEGGVATPANHVSVAYAIENLQTTGTPMMVYRSTGTLVGGAEPAATNINIGAAVTLADPSIASVHVNNRVSGIDTHYPRPFLAPRLISDTQYELWYSDSGNTKTYRTEVVEWPTAVPIYTGNEYYFFVDNNALNPTDAWPVGASDVGENAPLTVTDEPPANGENIRIRMTLNMTDQVLPPSGEQFKLQFGTRSTTCSAIASWTDLGAPASAALWRGFNAAPADGTSLGSQLIAVSDVSETYEEQNNSALNPNAIGNGMDGEWDWNVQNNTAVPKTTYCFRMVQSDGSAFDAYTNYPTITTPGFRPESRNWRWYNDETNETPTAALAAENVSPSSLVYNNTVKLRMTLEETGGLSESMAKFRLQYSEFSDFSDGGTFVPEVVDCVEGSSLWCYGDGTDIDGDAIITRVLTDATANGAHNESAGLAVVGEVGSVATNNAGTTVNLNNTYTNPVVITEPITGDNTGGAGDPAAAIVSNVTATSFDVRMQEPDNELDDHGSETVSYIVMEEGNWEFAGGIIADVGSFSLASSNFYGNNVAPDSYASCNFGTAFSAAPIVLAGLQTDNNTGTPDFLTASTDVVTTSGFNCAIEVPDNESNTPGSGETVGWIAFERDEANNAGNLFETSDTGANLNGWTDSWYNFAFTQAFGAAPRLIAHKQSVADPDGGWVRYDTLLSTSVDLAVDERDDGERAHGTAETAGIFAFAASDNLYALNNSSAHSANTAEEYEFTIRHVGAKPNVTYFFRAWDVTNWAAVDTFSGETYPSISTEGSRATLTVSGVAASTVTEGVTADVTTTATTIPFGMLNFSAQTEAAQTLTVDTNATDGYQVFLFEDQQLTNGMGGTISVVTGTNAAPSAWATGCVVSAKSCYGYHAGDDVLIGPSTRFTANDTYAQFSTSLEEVAYAGNPVDNQANDIVFKIEIRLDSDTGNFSNTLTYILVPLFN